MGRLPLRRLASTALCAALLAGVTGPAAVAADTGREHAVPAASRAPVPGADALLAQVKRLGNLGTVLTPVTALLDAVLKADNGQLPADQATQLVQAAKDAIAKAGTAVPATKAAGGAHTRADLVSAALTALTQALDTLLKAVTSGNAAQVVPAVTGVVTGLVNYLAALLLGTGLPAANLPGLPSLPSLPVAVPSVPATPAVPAS
ncbi:hypothetical protein ACWDFL_13330 [Streptomyces bungoensis]